MKSKTAVTFQIDEPEIAAQELYEKTVQDFNFQKNSVGLLFCYSDMDADVLVSELAAKFSFPIVGGSAIASMDRLNGFHEMAATLCVLTADDCDFSVSVSEPITPKNVTAQIKNTYSKAVAALPGTPGLIYALPPYLLEIMLDTYTSTFNDIAPGVPFVGGLPSYNGSGDENFTIAEGKLYSDRLIILAASGNIRPVFSVQTVAGCNDSKKRIVTKSSGNVVHTVGERSFTEYLADIGLPLELLSGGNSTVTFVANPLLVEEHSGGETFKYLRSLHAIDLDAGTGTAIGRVPEGSYITVCPMNRDEIAAASALGMKDLKGKMASAAADGYEFSTVFAVSCIGRYVIMAPNSNVEVNGMLSEFPENLNLAGFYSYGEISPLPTAGASVIFAHNESLVLCAF